jgi:hypothetical protein
MATVAILAELLEVPDNTGPKWVEVDVAHQLEQIGVFFTKKRLAPVLEELTMSAMATIELLCMAGQHAPHDGGERYRAGSQQEVRVLCEAQHKMWSVINVHA